MNDNFPESERIEFSDEIFGSASPFTAILLIGLVFGLIVGIWYAFGG